MVKTFAVRMANGERKEAQQLATFTRYLKGAQFRFVVTQLPGELPAVTHRQSGMRVVPVAYSTLAACRNDAKEAGYLALTNLVADKGEDRVHDVLSRAESTGYPLTRPAT